MPPGYGQQPRSQGGSRTALFTVIALVVGLGAGLLIGWPIFSAETGNEAGSAEYDVEVMCNYVAQTPDLAAEFETDGLIDRPTLWRLQAIGILGSAAERADSSISGFEKAGMDLHAGISRMMPQDATAALEDLKDLCAQVD